MTAPTRAGRHAGTEGDPPSRVPGLLMGLGLGGLLDAVVLHQILQWHHMLSDTDGNSVTTLKGMEASTLADGVLPCRHDALHDVGSRWPHCCVAAGP